MHNLKLEKIPKVWENRQILGLFLNQTCFFYRTTWFKHGLNKCFSMEHGFKNQTWNFKNGVATWRPNFFFNRFDTWKNKPQIQKIYIQTWN